MYEMTLLEYETEMLKEALDEDSLMIFSAGLSMNRILVEMFKHFIQNQNFVVITGIEPPDDTLLINKFKNSYTDLSDEQLNSIRIIDSNFSMSDRRKTYAKPNVLFISGRILVVDLLANRIPVQQINGLIILDAHKVTENCLEAFICRLFRSKNRNGFIKGFSERANLFCNEMNKLDRAMRYMFLKRLSLWPRFHTGVNESFHKRSSPEVIELRLPLTELMKKIQYSIFQLISNCLKEIARSNLSILSDSESLTPENVICWNLNHYYARHFYPIWNQLNPKTKRILEDIKLLKSLLFSLTSDDCVTFYQIVNSIRDGIRLNENVSDWIFWEPTEIFFVSAKKRLELPVPKDPTKSDSQPDKGEANDDPDIVFDDEELFKSDDDEEIDNVEKDKYKPIEPIEPPPPKKLTQEDTEIAKIESNQKWDTFYDVMEEIKSNLTNDHEMISVFVLVENDRTIDKLQQVLDRGSKDVLKEMYHRKRLTLNQLIDEIKVGDHDEQNLEDKETLDEQAEGPSLIAGLNTSMMTQVVNVKNIEKNETQQVFLNIVFHCFREGSINFENKLYYYKPWYTIFYDYNISCVRMLEVYQATYCSPERCHIYLLIYDSSAEEQKYFSNLRSEKESFERLIREKCSLVIPVERDGRNGLNLDLIRGRLEHDNVFENSLRDQSKNLEKLKNNKNLYFCEDCLQQMEEDEYPVSSTDEEEKKTQEEEAAKLCACCHRLNRNQVVRQKIIVDMREFRSVLPSIIHKRGIDIIPSTISIGDYILTPDICVERKSISDLTQSLQSGRLYSQCKMMIRHYKKAFLLIEFDQKRSFSMKGKYWNSDRNETSILSEYNIMSKLILLSIHFPRLKYIWSPTPEFSAEVFEELKKGKEEPSVKKAQTVTENELDPEYHEDRYDLQLKDFLLNLPGLNFNNVNRIMNNVDNIAKLITLSKQELIKLLDSEDNGTKLYESLHKVTVDQFCANTKIRTNNKKVFKKI